MKTILVLLVLAVAGAAVISIAATPLERNCKLCEESCCPKKNNCSCLHTDSCSCVEPTGKNGDH